MKKSIPFLLVLFLVTGCSTLSLNPKKQFIFDEPIKALKMTVDYDPAFFPSNNICGKVTVQNYGINDYKRVTMMFSFTDSFGTILATNTFCLTNGMASGSTATIQPNLNNPLHRANGVFGANTFRSCPLSMNSGRVEINTEMAVKKEGISTDVAPQAESKPPEKVYDIEVNLLGTQLDRRNVFDDGKIQISFSIDKAKPKSISFTLENKTENAVVIDWNKMAYIDLSRTAQRVIHEGVKYSQRNENMRDTIVPPRSKVGDVILPVDKIYDGGRLGWQALSLFYGESITMYSQAGKTPQVSIYMPLLIGNEKKEYTFTFDVKATLRE